MVSSAAFPSATSIIVGLNAAVISQMLQDHESNSTPQSAVHPIHVQIL